MFEMNCGFTKDAMESLEQASRKLQNAQDCLDACREQLFEGGDPWPRLEELAQQCGVHLYTVHLLFLIRCAPETGRRYEKAGISREIFWDSMKDLRYKAEETHRIYGIWGVYCGKFLSGLLLLRCFCLGRLQFEMMKSDFSCRVGSRTLSKGDPVINVHIPSFGKLQYGAVEAAYESATVFFRRFFPEGDVWFRCETWFFYPQVRGMLPRGNMQRFASDYTVVHAWIDPMQDDRYRVFDLPADVLPEQYPQNNPLRKKLKTWLLAGNTMGVGIGFLLWSRGKAVSCTDSHRN